MIERALQTIDFIAQASANLWVRNGLIIQNIVSCIMPYCKMVVPGAYIAAVSSFVFWCKVIIHEEARTFYHFVNIS